MTTATAAPTSGYAPVNGLQMYYEIHGDGQPTVLLHGGLSTIETSFSKILPALAATRKVIAVEFQAHGHTRDIDRTFNMESLAEDVVALLGYLQIEQADLFGYSIGAGVALNVAIRHPARVRKLVLASVSYNNSGLHPGMLGGIEALTAEMFIGSPFHAAFVAASGRPEDFPRMLERVKELDRQNPEWSAETIKSVSAPMLLVIGDSDIVQPEHAVEMFRLVGGGVAGDLQPMPVSQLAIIPGASHITLVDRSELLVPMVERFLAS